MRARTAIAVVTGWVIAAGAPVHAQESAARDSKEPESEPESGESTPADPERVDAEVPGALTTPLWRQPERFDLHWKLLAIPETLVEIAASPFALLVGVTEEYRLDRRVVDLLEFADGRVKIRPKAKLSFGDGLGVGADLLLRRLFSKRRANMDFGAVYRLDGDYKLDYLYNRAQPQLEGREIDLYIFREIDGNSPYFGVNGDSDSADRRVLKVEDLAATLSIDLHRPGALTFSGVGEIGFRRQEVEGGIDGTRIPAGEPGDTVPPPPGFEEQLNFLEFSVAGARDTRDVHGRPTRGNLTEARLLAAMDVTGADFSGVKLEAQTAFYLPVLPLSRVLVLTAGATVTFAPIDDHEVPLTMLPALGRKRFLRGYDRDRFRDRHAAWANLEYRYPIYEFLTTRAGLDAFFFVDGATAFGEADLELGNLRYSYGAGLRGALETTLLVGFTAGFSPEGFEINLGIGRDL